MTRPNLLFVFSDQHRRMDLGCYGNPQVHSPNLDAFAAEAVQFEHCISNSPLCVPARGTLLTGLMPLGHRAVSNDLPIRTDLHSIADVMGSHGYHTGYIGKWHLAGIPRDQSIPEGRGRLGFKEWKVCNCSHNYMDVYYDDEHNVRHPIEGYEPIKQTDLALDYIERNKDREWMLYLSWGPPHDPYQAAPQRYLDRYADMDIRIRDNVKEEAFDRPGKTWSRQDVLACHRGYYAHITALDEQFGRLIHGLEATGQLDNTIVVYTSDHGDMLGSQGFMNKQLPYEESVNVPLLVYWKGRTFQGKANGMMGLADLPVSLLGLLGLSFPEPVDGRDLHRLFVDPHAEGPEDCYIFDLVPCHQAAWREIRDWRGIRTPRYTFARTPYDQGYILYDNVKDPLQLDNRIDDPAYAEVKQRLLDRLNRHIARHDKLCPWEQLIKEQGLLEEWNRSQAYFRLPLLEE